MYFEKELRGRFRREPLPRDEAQRIAAAFTKLPECCALSEPAFIVCDACFGAW
jgi:hypothetical protein